MDKTISFYLEGSGTHFRFKSTLRELDNLNHWHEHFFAGLALDRFYLRLSQSFSGIQRPQTENIGIDDLTWRTGDCEIGSVVDRLRLRQLAAVDLGD